MKRLYRAEVDIEDDPARFESTVILWAENNREARKMARAQSLDHYWNSVPGWSTSRATATVMSCRLHEMPTDGVVAIFADYR